MADDYEVIGSNPSEDVKDYEVVGSNPIEDIVPSKYARGERSLVGNIFERPGAAVRSTLLGRGYKQGAMYPEEVPRFQDLILDAYYNKLPSFPGKSILGLAPSTLGLTADIATNPADLLGLLAGKIPMGKGKTLGEVISKSVPGQAVGRFANMPISQTGPVRAVKGMVEEVGKSGIFKQGKDYIYEKLAKPAANYVNQHIKNFPDSAKKALGLRDETVALLKKHGYDKVSNPVAAHEEANAAFKTAMEQKTTVYGDKIDIRRTLAKMQNAYNNIKRVDPNNPLGKIINDIKKLIPAPKGFYAKRGKIPTPGQLSRRFAGEQLYDIAGEVRVSRTELCMLRDKLNNLYKDRGFDRKVFDIIDTLYADAEKAGLKGVQAARRLTRDAHAFDKVQTNLGKIEKIDSAKIFTDLNSVVENPSKYQLMIDKYSPYMGIDKAHQLFRQALSIRHGKQVIGGLKMATGLTAAGTVASSIGKKIVGSIRQP